MTLNTPNWSHISAESALLPARQHLDADILQLTTIFSPDVNLSVWQRSLSQDVQIYANNLIKQLRHSLQRRLAIIELPEFLQRTLPEAPEQAAFIDDIVQVAELFSCLMACETLGLRLSVLQQPMCPKFHTDHLVCRLVTTYCGPGTEWHSGKVGDKVMPQQLQVGDVALLKGSGWEDRQTYAICHRSPAVAAARLLLTLDPI